MLIDFINETKDVVIDSNKGVNVTLLSSLCNDIEFSNFTKKQAQLKNININVYPTYLILNFYWQNKNDLKYAVNELNIEYSNQLKKDIKKHFRFISIKKYIMIFL